MKKNNLSVILFFCTFLTLNAQKIIKKDSLQLFTIGFDQLNQNAEIIKSKGHFTNFSVEENGEINLILLKQHFGYLIPEKKKGLFNSSTMLPGLTKINYSQSGFSLDKEVIFNLNSGLKIPFKYTFQDITSMTGGVSAKDVISNESTAVDFNTILSDEPQSVNFEGSILNKTVLTTDGNFLWITKNKLYYTPFLGSYRTLENNSVKQLTISVVPNGVVVSDNNLRATYLQPKDKSGKSLFITVDTTGKQIVSFNVPEINGLNLALTSRVEAFNNNNIITSDNHTSYTGYDWLFVPADKKSSEYVVVRTNEKGELVFKQKFTAAVDGYSYAQSAMLSNNDETFVRIILGKGVLRYETFFIKLNSEKVIYNKMIDKENEKKSKVISNASPSVGGFSLDLFVSLPNGESFIGGYDNMITKKYNDYSFMHLSNDGTIKNYYNMMSYVPKVEGLSFPNFYPIIIDDSKILIVTKEARSLGNPLSQFTYLNSDLIQSYVTTEASLIPGKKYLYFNYNVPKTEQPAPKSGGLGGLVNKLDKLNSKIENLGGGDNEVKASKEPIQMDGTNTTFMPAGYLIDFKAEKVNGFDFGKVSGFSSKSLPFFIYDKGKRSLNLLTLTLPRPVSGKPSQYPKAVFLKSSIFEF